VATLEFVNHASYLLEHGPVTLLCDPWLEGPAFDFGWDLLTDTRLSHDRFGQITHIWFSHEHPDHFSPPSINKIPAEARARITVLFQNSLDHKVAKYCGKLGFRVIEMNPGEWLELGPGVQALCEPHDNGDSWLAVRTPQSSILNLNDCVVNSEAECRSIVGKVTKVDVLASQFSYANWVGNRGDRAAMTAAARDKLGWFRTQILTLRPKYVMPFASFTFFSHEDNFYLNEGMTTIAGAVEYIRRETPAEPVVLYPGDRWDLSAKPPDVEKALHQYAADYERVKRGGPRHRSRLVRLDTVVEHGNAFARTLRGKNGALLKLFPPTTIFLEDHGQAVALSSSGLRTVARDRTRCDLVCKSDALDYCFSSEWGGRTLDINGRFQAPAGGRYAKFKVYMTLANFNNRGEGFREILTTVYRRGRKKLRRLATRS